MNVSLTCRECGEEFSHSNNRVAYCSDKCRTEKTRRLGRESYHRNNNNGWVRQEIQCAYDRCGKTFLPKTSRSKYCSSNCSQMGHYYANPEKHKAEQWRRKYGITPEAYQELLDRQGGTCVCGHAPDDRYLSVDHNHACCPGDKSCGECVRGLLCNDCNISLGFLRDDPNRLMVLAQYLVQFEDVLNVL